MITTTVPETPEPPNAPPMPVQRVQEYVQTLPITPVRLQGQRWRNWGLTRLSHLPSVRYSDSEIIANLEEQRWQDSQIMQQEEHEQLVESAVETVTVVEELNPPENPPITITAKPVKKKTRKLVFEVPHAEKAKATCGKWTHSYQGGETFCVDGFSYLINNHRISVKTGALTLYLICAKCGGRNILTDGKLKTHDHPGHTCSPDPDNWDILEADRKLKSLGE